MSLPNNPVKQRRTGKPGRPVTVDGKMTSIYLDQRSLEIALAIGGGNISAGIRLALAAYEAAK